MAFTKINSLDGEYVNLENSNDAVEGIVRGVTKDVPTKYGTVDMLQLQTLDGGNLFMVRTTNLAFIPWEQFTGCLVRIELKGFEVNQKTGNRYKKFAVYVDNEYTKR